MNSTSTRLSNVRNSARYAPNFLDSLLALGLAFGLAVVMAIGISLAGIGGVS